MKKLLLISFLATSLFAYYDFGVVGNTYEIEENDLIKQIQEAYKKVDKKQLEKQYKQAIRDSLVGTLHLPYCQKNKIIKTNIFNNKVAPKDIDIEEAGIHIKAGTKMSQVYFGQYLSYALINLNSPQEVSWLNDLGMSTKNVILSEGDLTKIKNKLEGTWSKYLLNERLKDSFKLNCTPSIFEIKDGYLVVREYKIDREKMPDEIIQKGDK